MTESLSSNMRPRNILLATDLSSRGDRAFDRATQLAQEWGATFHVVHAVDSLPPSVPVGVNAGIYLQKHPDPKLEAIRQLRRLIDNTPAKMHVEDAPAAQALLTVAERVGCDLIVLGESRGRLVVPLEGTVDEVVRKSPVSVLVVRNRAASMYKRVVVGTDFTDEAKQALETSARLFPAAGHTLLHAYSIPYPGLLDSASASQDWRAVELEKLRAHLEEADLPRERKNAVRIEAIAGPPAAALRRYLLDKDVDLAVIGAQPRGILFDTLVGSSRLIVDAIPGDVLVVRAARRASK